MLFMRVIACTTILVSASLSWEAVAAEHLLINGVYVPVVDAGKAPMRIADTTKGIPGAEFLPGETLAPQAGPREPTARECLQGCDDLLNEAPPCPEGSDRVAECDLDACTLTVGCRFPRGELI